MTNFRLYATLILFALLAACSGGGDGGGQSDTTSTSSSASAAGWPGRIWFVKDQVLYASAYSDDKKAVVDSSFQINPGSTHVVQATSTGKFVLIYSHDAHFTRTDFSVRTSIDAKEIFRLTAEKFTYSAQLSNDGRFLAWHSADEYSPDLGVGAAFSVLELRTPEQGGVRLVGNVLNTADSPKGVLKKFQWVGDNRLMFVTSAGEVFEYSVLTGKSFKALSIPAKNGQYAFDVRSIVFSAQGDKLAGYMALDENHRELWTANVDGSNLEVKTQLNFGLGALNWSPDGKWIHIGDCRVADYGGTPTYSIPIGRRSWIIPSSSTKLGLSELNQYEARYLHEGVYDYTMPCLFTWTQ